MGGIYGETIAAMVVNMSEYNDNKCPFPIKNTL
jgi:hypothetical protein